MNTVSRLSFVLFSIIGFAIFTYGFTSSGKLSDGQSLMLWSTVPASLMLLIGAFHTKENLNEVVALMVMLVGTFFMMLCFGMKKQSGEEVYGFFALGGLTISGFSVLMLLTPFLPRTNNWQS